MATKFTDNPVVTASTTPIAAEEAGVKGYTTPLAILNLTNFTFSVNTSSPNESRPVASFTGTNAASSVDVAIIPKSLGAIMCRIPDGTSTGGNKRGSYAVDWQRIGSATQVASGQSSTVGGGSNNTASSTNATVAGGSSNIASFGASTVGGGTTNTASGNISTVGGGSTNTANNTYSTVGGGSSNVASGTQSTVPGGNANTASGTASTAFGDGNTASGSHTVATGSGSTTRSVQGAMSHATGYFSVLGDAQREIFVMRATTTDATPTELKTGNNSVIALPNGSAYSFSGQIIARSSTGNTAGWRFSGTIERGANAAATAIVGTVLITDTNAEAGASTWAASVVANTTGGNLSILVTGETGVTIRWVTTVETVEVVY